MISFITGCIYLLYLTCAFTNGDANLRTSFLPFSKLTNQFLLSVQPNNALNITKTYIYKIIDNNVTAVKPETIVNEYWRTYVGYLILITIGLLFIIIFNIFGFCLCCCRCCCKRCGAKPLDAPPTDHRKKRTILIVLFFVFTTMILIGAIVSMASNVILLEAFKPYNDTTDKDGNLIGNIDTTLTQTIAYINYLANNTIRNGTSAISNILPDLSSTLSSSLTLFLRIFQEKLNFQTILNSTDQVINGYTNLTNGAAKLSNISFLHLNKTTNFIDYLKIVSGNLSTLLNDPECQIYTSRCQQLNASLSSLTIGYDQNQINYTADMAMNYINDVNTSSLANAKNNINQTMTSVITNVTSNFNDILKNFTSSFNGTMAVSNILNSTVASKDNLISTLSTYMTVAYGVKIFDGTIYSYYRYVFYAFLAVICLVLLIVLLFYIGLMFGVFGYPNYENASYCNKGVGNGFLTGGISLSFMFGWLLMLLVTLMFLLGGVVQTEGCRYVTVESDHRPLQIVDEIINRAISKFNISFFLGNVSMTIPKLDYVQSLLVRCPTSTDLISAFQIPTDYFSPVSNFVYNSYVSPHLTTIIQRIKDFNIPDLNIDPVRSNIDSMRAILVRLENINSTSTLIELRKPVTGVQNFSQFIDNLFALSNVSSANPTFSKNLYSIAVQLRAEEANMSQVQRAYLQAKTDFNGTIYSVDNSLTFLDNVLNLLNSNITNAKVSAADAMGSDLGGSLPAFINKTLFNIIQSLGNCQGLALAANSAIGTICTTFLKPFNNIWMGLGWFLLFIIPAIIVALKIQGLNRISKVDNVTPNNDKAYQSTNLHLTARDMEMIRMKRPTKI